MNTFIRSDENIHGVAVVIPTNHREIPGSTPGRYNLQIELTSLSLALSLVLAHPLSLIRLMAQAGNARGGGGGEKGNAVGSGGREESERDCVDAGNIVEGGSFFEEESLFGKLTLTGPLPQ